MGVTKRLMKHLKLAAIILPWFIIGGLLFGSVAFAEGNTDKLNGLAQAIKGILDAFKLFLESL